MSSSIDVTKPANNSLLVSQEIRTLATAAKTDIEALQAQIGNGVGQGVSYFLTSTLSDTGTYDVMSRSPDNTSEVVESVVVNNNTATIDVYIAEALARTEIPAGEWSFDFFLYTSLATATTYITLSLYKRASGGAETLLFSVNSPELNNTIVANYNIKTVQQAFTVLTTDRLVLKVTATTNHNGNVTVSLVHSGTEHYSHIVTTLAVETSQSIGTLIAGSGAKTTPVGADTLAISDSEDGNKLKKFSFTNLATWLLTQLVGTTKALKSATTVVDVSAAAAPTSGQVLTATSGSAATWQSFSISFNDNTFAVIDEVDPTKKLVISVGGNATTKVATIVSACTTDNTYTLPNYTMTFVGAVSNYAILAGTSASGIKVGGATPKLGSADLRGTFVVDTSGGAAPAIATFDTGIEYLGYNQTDISRWDFHVEHRDVLGGNKKLHIHLKKARGSTVTVTTPTITNLIITAVVKHSYHNFDGQTPRGASPAPITVTFTITPAQLNAIPDGSTGIFEANAFNTGGTSGLLNSSNLFIDDDISVQLTFTTVPPITGGATNRIAMTHVDFHREVNDGSGTYNADDVAGSFYL